MTKPAKLKQAFNHSLRKWRETTNITETEESLLRDIYYAAQTHNYKILINPHVTATHPLRVIPIQTNDEAGFQRMRNLFEAMSGK